VTTPFISRDPTADVRTRRGLGALADIINSLLRSGQIVRAPGGEFEIVVAPDSVPPPFVPPEGSDGDPPFGIGTVGAAGAAGAPGRSGWDGWDGADGLDGLDGPAGPTGARGERGPPGFDGVDAGDEGPPITIPAQPAPQTVQDKLTSAHTLGAVADTWENVTNFNVTIPDTGRYWFVGGFFGLIEASSGTFPRVYCRLQLDGATVTDSETITAFGAGASTYTGVGGTTGFIDARAGQVLQVQGKWNVNAGAVVVAYVYADTDGKSHLAAYRCRV
jgi:hypothetical protein